MIEAIPYRSSFTIRMTTTIKLVRPNLYDYIKIFAIVTMIVDHIWFFFYPHTIELRMIGRIAFPLFFFLIGWNGSSRIDWSLRICAIVIQSSMRYLSVIWSYNLWQLNILPVAIIVKYGIWYIKKTSSILPIQPLTFFLLTSIILTPFTQDFMEYGLMWFVMAIVWLYSKWFISQSKQNRHYKHIGIIWLWIIWLIIVNHSFPFSIYQWILIICSWIATLSVSSFCDLNKDLRFHNSIDNIVLFMSNYAVRIYCLHFLIFLAIVISK